MPFGFLGASTNRNFIIYGRLPPETIEVLVVGGGGNSSGHGGAGGGGVQAFVSIQTNMTGTPTPTFICPAIVGGRGAASSFTINESTYTATGGSGGGNNGGAQGSPNGYGGGSATNRPSFGIVSGGGGGGFSAGGQTAFISSYNWFGGYVGRTCDWGGLGGSGYLLDGNAAAILGVSYVGSGGGGCSTGGACPNSAPGLYGGGSGNGGNATMYGCGGGGCGGLGQPGIVVVRYLGPQAAPGGNVYYSSGDQKTYHVFTASGTLEL